MRFFALSINMLLVRYFLMMACVIGGLFIGQPVIALLALPIFLSAILGISILPEPVKQAKQESAAGKAVSFSQQNLKKVA